MTNTIFDITARWDEEAGVWVGVSDDLSLATEAETLEALYARVTAVAPEIAALSGDESARFRIVTEPVPLVAAE